MSTSATLADIETLVPHSGPMLLIDRVVTVDNENLCAEVTITEQSLFCGAQGVGVWIGVEYMAQAIAAHAGHAARLRGEELRLGFLLGARRYDCRRSYFATGSILHVHVKRSLQGENGLGAFECRIDVANEPDGRAAAIATITVYQPPDVQQFFQETTV
jgi:predicted hotdog family 3-hydroxylacyl-ACP dehydratase